MAAIEKVKIYTEVFKTPEELLSANNQMNFNASNTLLIAIAEETKKIAKELQQTEPSIYWKNIADMRNILAHDYRGVDPEIVFDVIHNKLPELKDALIRIIKLLPSEEVQVALQTKQYNHLRLF